MPPSNSEESRKFTDEHYRELAGLILQDAGTPEKIDYLKKTAKASIAEIEASFPGVDRAVTNSVLASIATTMAMLLRTPLKSVPEVMTLMFDSNMLAVAHNLGVIDLDTMDGSTVEEMIKTRLAEAEERLSSDAKTDTLDEVINRQYL